MPKPNKAEQLIFKAFKKASEQNMLHLYLDTSRLNRPNSPIYNPWENLLPLLIPITIGLILIMTVSILFGLAFIIGMVLIYNFYIKRLIEKRLLDRAKKYISIDYEHCQNLWDFGGLVLATTNNKTTGCIAPEGDWKDFIVKNFAELMTDKITQEKEIKNEKSAA